MPHRKLQILKKHSGITLIETLISLTVVVAVALGVIFWYLESQREQQATVFGKDIVSIVTAFDKRIHIDGLDLNNFKNGSEWSSSGALMNMLNTEFSAKDSTCGGTTNWVPVLAEENKTQLIPCNLWAKIPYNFNAKAKITADTKGYIKSFRVIFQAKSPEAFSQNFRYYNKAIMSAKAKDSMNITGGHQFYFASLSDPTTKLTNSECIALKNNCTVVAAYDREGGNEYLRVDGTNSVIGSSVTFKNSKDSDKLHCLKWVQDTASGSWSSSTVDCGIGIHKVTGSPVAVDIAAGSSTNGRVLLDRLCPVYSNSSDGFVDSSQTAPCGMQPLSDAGAVVAYQVVDNVSARKGLINRLYTNTIFSNQINTNYMQVKNDLSVLGNTAMEGNLGVRGTTSLNGSLGVNGPTSLNSSLGVNGAANLNNNLTVQGITSLNNNVSVKGTASFDRNINLSEVEVEGASCSPSGSVARNTQGAILSCVSGFWTNSSGANLVAVGTFGGTFGGLSSGDHGLTTPLTQTVGKYSSCFLTSFYTTADPSGSGCRLTKNSSGVWTITTLTQGGSALSCSVGCLQ